MVGAIHQHGESNVLHRALTLREACTCIEEARSQLLHSPIIEAEAFYRLRNYPKQINGSLHHAVVHVPRNLAYILHQSAAYISPAVEAFYLRDPIALRPLQAQSENDLVFPPKDLVTMVVKFTKVGFAQVKSQRFSAPAAWTSVLSARKSEQSRAQTELGMKVTSGFEMLVSDPQNQDHKVVREIKLILGDLAEGEDQLPSDAEISQWGMVEDDEAWLDVNFEDLASVTSLHKRTFKRWSQDSRISWMMTQQEVKVPNISMIWITTMTRTKMKKKVSIMFQKIIVARRKTG